MIFNETTLVVGDCHVEQDEDLTRFRALGNYIVEQQPENIVIIGDFLSLDSLSAWDRNKRAVMEGRRFGLELKHAAKALDLMELPTKLYNKRKKKIKHKQYRPNRIFISGNHEDRWFRYLDQHAELIDVIDIWKEIGLYKYGWKVTPYREYIYLNGVGFTHVPMNGINKPVGGVTALRKAATEHANSVVYGHSHKLGLETFTHHGKNERQIMSLNVGCFFEGVPQYAKGSLLSKDWWRGVIMLRHLNDDGLINVSAIDMQTLLNEYD